MKVSGLDIHKDSVYCAIYNGKKQEEVKVFSTLTEGIKELGEYLRKEKVKKVAMESTGIYWMPVWNILESMGFELMLVNPFLIKQMPGRKSDVKDSQWIAKLLYKGMLRGSLVPDKQVRFLRSYGRRYIKLSHRINGVVQSMEHQLEIMGIRLSSFLSSITGKTFINIVRAIVNGETDAEELLKKVHGRIRNKYGRDNIKASLTGFITEHHLFILSQLLEEYDLLKSQRDAVYNEMKKIVKEHYEKEKELLTSIPGVDELSATFILAESGANMKSFDNSSKFASWIGLAPRNDESAGKYKSTAITKGNKYLRAILVQVAWASIRTKGSYFKQKYNRLAVRKSKKKALIAIARKVSVVIWNVLSNMESYNPDKLPEYDPVKLKKRQQYYQRELDKITELLLEA